ncbi:DUF2878 domain-containing protein [Photobacterium sanctipauli]|uniref:DUF2878 domain-containing protein n=1 Tax=Photobacterium sanctipauli TaxID=1342794 RepID=A0A2T3NVA8_9GAMM|nr:DUF2878 domain-containing protein [Photobacterium sanctipauli]PSW20185.1 DUF2878 domain-containing protein [Photobacterium sanctipauli]
MTTKELIAVGTVFNVFWFVAVLGQAQYSWVLLSILIFSWWRFHAAFKFGVAIGSAGILMDMALKHFALYQFATDSFPLWLALLWLGFGTFVWIIREKITSYSAVIIMALGGVGGMMSYFAGYRLGAVIWPYDLSITLPTILLCWIVFSGFILLTLKHIAGYYRRTYEHSIYR